jgi:hypothetical protein
MVLAGFRCSAVVEVRVRSAQRLRRQVRSRLVVVAVAKMGTVAQVLPGACG